MKVLGLDTSCDESCAAIYDSEAKRLLADIVHSHVVKMGNYGGIVPEIASREHLKALPLAVNQALRESKLTLDDIDCIAVTNRPGLIGALLVGVTYAKALALAANRPFHVINHIEAHLLSPMLAGQAPAFPWIALVVSGGHTELFHVESPTQFRWLGGTLDDAAGEAFDKVGKLLGMPYPAGPQIDKQTADVSDELRKRYKFPRAKLDGFNFSFSGLKTAVSLQVKRLGEKRDSEKLAVAASAQEAILDSLVDKTTKAAEALGVSQIVVTGGVACNSRLRKRMPTAYFPSPKHCSDNAAMVALAMALQRPKPAAWNTTAHASLELG